MKDRKHNEYQVVIDFLSEIDCVFYEYDHYPIYSRFKRWYEKYHPEVANNSWINHAYWVLQYHIVSEHARDLRFCPYFVNKSDIEDFKATAFIGEFCETDEYRLISSKISEWFREILNHHRLPYPLLYIYYDPYNYFVGIKKLWIENH